MKKKRKPKSKICGFCLKVVQKRDVDYFNHQSGECVLVKTIENLIKEIGILKKENIQLRSMRMNNR